MANIADCIEGAVKAGQLDPARAKEAKENFEQLRDRYVTTMPLAQAEAAAAADLKEATEAAGRRRFHAVVNQLQSMRRIRQAIETADDPAVAIKNLIEFSPGSGYRGESVRQIREAYDRRINFLLHEFLEETGINPLGMSRDKAKLLDVVRELHGQSTGNARAAELAQAVMKAQDEMRRSFNALGGDIGRLDGYGLPHSHDVIAVRKAGFKAWRDEIEGKLAWDKIINNKTGKAFSETAGDIPPSIRTEGFLKKAYDNMVTRGEAGEEPSMSVGGKALYNQRADHRVLHFKDGDSWIEYNQRFGGSDPFSALMNGLYGLSRDVAMMRVLGPNPRLGLEYAAQVAKKRVDDAVLMASSGEEVARANKLEGQVRSGTGKAKAMLAQFDGSASIPENEVYAAIGAGTRAVLQAAQLGSAVLSSFSDMATMRMTAKIMGMQPNNFLARSVQLLGSHATRETAARMGFVSGALADAGGGSARYFGQLFGTGIPERLAGVTMRISGLSYVTEMRKIAFQMEFAGFLAENAKRGFADIDPKLREIFESRGITPADWDALRAPEARFVDEASGADFIAPDYWLETQTAMSRAEAEGLSTRLGGVMSEYMEYAIPSASLEGRASLITLNQPGTIPGELLRSVAMYKSFAMSLTLNQMRLIKMMPGIEAKAFYAGELGLMMLTMGALSIQLKEIVKGRDPRPMSDLSFWGAALLQGGGLGIFGDFFSSSTSRAGGGFAETLAGPVVGLGGDLLRAVNSNAVRAAEGKPLLIGRDVSNLVRRNTPVASSLWYGRAAFDRWFADYLQRRLDPEAEALWRRQERKREKEYGSSSWWRSGEALPYRPPNFSNIVEAAK